mgnify:CR=1 FL=1
MILVTGSGTLLGREISQLLVHKNNKILSSYNKSFPKKIHGKKKPYFIKIDLEKKIKIKHKISTLIHCASIGHGYGLSNQKIFTKNIKIFKNLLEICKKNNCKKIILISTMSVYGKFTGIITDQTKTNPINGYSKAKLEMEKILIKYSRKNKCTYFILRIPVLLGKNSKNNFLSVLFKKIKNNKRIKFSNPDVELNTFIEAKTVAKIVNYLILSKFSNLILNLCAKNTLKLKKIIDQIYSGLKKKRNYVFDQNTKHFNISISKLKKYQVPIISMSQTIKKFLDANIK